VELVGEALRKPQRHQLDAISVISVLEVRKRFVADGAGRRVGDEPFRTEPDFGADMPLPVLARFLGHHEHDDAAVPRRIAGLAVCPDLPLPADVQSDFFDWPPAEIGECDNDDLAAGLGAYIGNDPVDRARLPFGDHMREVVDVPHGLRNLQPLESENERGRNEKRGGAKIHQ
jgi:hypothetical protein